MGMTMMQMWFTTGGWSKDNSLTMLFSWWVSDTYPLYVLTLVLVFGLGMIQEFLSVVNSRCAVSLSRAYEKVLRVDPSSTFMTGDTSDVLEARIKASLAHGLFIGWHFIAMLVFMTYNVGACVVLVLGITVGHFIFKTDKPAEERMINDCCDDEYGAVRRVSPFRSSLSGDPLASH